MASFQEALEVEVVVSDQQESSAVSNENASSHATIDWGNAMTLITKMREMIENSASQPSANSETNEDNLSSDLHLLALCMSTHFHDRKSIPSEVMHALLDVSISRHKQLPNVMSVCRSKRDNGEYGSLVVVGDTHGQYMDVHHIFQPEVTGPPSNDNRYIFNGDIVDRGDMAVEILAVLLTFKLACDDSVVILRGNHETTYLNRIYGFQDEVLEKFALDYKLLRKFRKLFSFLPIAAVIEEKIFVVHGGLGRKTMNLTVAELNAFDRTNDAHPINEELHWKDPHDDLDEDFKCNPYREGGGETFGLNVTNHFLEKNHWSLMIRSHSTCDHGWMIQHNNRCLTIFSAPNYCGGLADNAGVVLKFSSSSSNELDLSFENLKRSLIKVKPMHYSEEQCNAMWKEHIEKLWEGLNCES